MARRALVGVLAVVGLCFAPAAHAQQDANAQDCAIGVGLPDGATCPPGESSCPASCMVPADYSSAMSCCGPALQVECNLGAGGPIPCDDVCSNAWCLPVALLPPGAGALALAALPDCNLPADAGQYKCVPEGLGESLGNVQFRTCHSFDGQSEGRCVPSCLNQVKDLATYLSQDVCLASEICAPCFDPRNGQASGACTIGCDTGPAEPAYVFEKCCAQAVTDGGGDAADGGGTIYTGMCVPKATVDAVVTGASALFRSNDCTRDANTVCVPQNLDISQLGSFACLKTAPADGGADSSADGAADSGSPPDAGSTGGTTGTGGATASTGGRSALDSGIDGGGTRGSKDEGSCGCRIGASESGGRGSFALTLVALGAALARTRGRARRTAR